MTADPASAANGWRVADAGKASGVGLTHLDEGTALQSLIMRAYNARRAGQPAQFALRLNPRQFQRSDSSMEARTMT